MEQKRRDATLIQKTDAQASTLEQETLQSRDRVRNLLGKLTDDVKRIGTVAKEGLESDVQNVKEQMSPRHLAERFPKTLALAAIIGGAALGKLIFASKIKSARSISALGASLIPKQSPLNDLPRKIGEQLAEAAGAMVMTYLSQKLGQQGLRNLSKSSTGSKTSESSKPYKVFEENKDEAPPYTYSRSRSFPMKH